MNNDESIYDDLKYFLEEEFECYPAQEDLQKIVNLSKKISSWQKNKGIRVERIKHPASNIEKAFHDQWLKENMPDRSVYNGVGLLQSLFITSHAHPFSVVEQNEVHKIINDRDRVIVATIIQWLGSNVGMGFLHEALARVGARIVFDKPQNHNNHEAK